MAAHTYNASTGVEQLVFVRKVPLDLSQQMCDKLVLFLAKVEQCGFWLVQASTLFFFPIPKNITSDWLIAFLPALIRSR